jgi:hypothetical protein
MPMSWDLENWLTDEGDRVIRKMAASGLAALNRDERLIYEVWVLPQDEAATRSNRAR